VAIYYVKDNLGDGFAPFLLALAAVKFFMVGSYFMHLRFDNRVLRRLFVTGIVLAIIIYIIVFLLLGCSPAPTAPTPDADVGRGRGVGEPVGVPRPPDTWLVVVVPAFCYWYAIRRIGPRVLGPRAVVATRRQISCFVLGLLAIEVASDWPIHDLAEKYLFSAHMVQHLLISLIARPCCCSGYRPGWSAASWPGPGPVGRCGSWPGRWWRG